MSTLMCPFCEVAYKTKNSKGWKLAIFDGDKNTVTEKCKQYNWFDYIILNVSEINKEYQIKDNLNYFPRPDIVHLTSYWIYWEELNEWFIKEDDIIPYPQRPCEETNKIQFSYDFEEFDDFNNISNFENDDKIYVTAGIEFETKQQKASAIIQISNLYKNFEKFIYDLKTKRFGVCHIDEFTSYKLLAWEKDNKIRFMIQNYLNNDNKKYIPIDFDVLVDKSVFFEYFEAFYNSLKNESKDLLVEMMNSIYKKFKKYNVRNNNNYQWEFLNIKTINELQPFVNNLKSLFYNETINKIFISPDIYDEKIPNIICNYDLKKINSDVMLATFEPVVFEIGNHKLVCQMYSGSDLNIYIDKNFIAKNKENKNYIDVSKLFSKNIINKKITNIKIEPIAKYDAEASSFDYYPDGVLSDDMFKNISIELENGYSLVIDIYGQQTAISELKNKNGGN